MCSSHLEQVTHFGGACRDASSRKFDHAPHPGADAGDAVGNQILPETNDAQFLVQTDDIDGELHAQSVNTGGRLDPKPSSGVEVTFAEQSEQASQRGVGDFDAVSEDGVAAGVSYGDEVHVTAGAPG